MKEDDSEEEGWNQHKTDNDSQSTLIGSTKNQEDEEEEEEEKEGMSKGVLKLYCSAFSSVLNDAADGPIISWWRGKAKSKKRETPHGTCGTKGSNQQPEKKKKR